VVGGGRCGGLVPSRLKRYLQLPCFNGICWKQNRREGSYFTKTGHKICPVSMMMMMMMMTGRRRRRMKVKDFFYCLRVSDTSALTHNNTQSVKTNKLFYSILNW
jgi:hypothetical protein